MAWIWVISDIRSTAGIVGYFWNTSHENGRRNVDRVAYSIGYLQSVCVYKQGYRPRDKQTKWIEQATTYIGSCVRSKYCRTVPSLRKKSEAGIRQVRAFYYAFCIMVHSASVQTLTAVVQQSLNPFPLKIHSLNN